MRRPPDRSGEWVCPRCATGLAADGDDLVCPGCGHRLARRGGVVWSDPGFRPERYAPHRREHLAGLVQDHFWFPPRRRLLTGILDRRVSGGPAAAAVELGCGTGEFLPVLAARFGAVTGVDAYGESLAVAAAAVDGSTGGDVELIQGDATRVPLAAGRFHLAVALDVLEHVDPDAFLTEAARLVAPGGWLLLAVPALPALWSELDEAAGHRCRYTRRLLAAELARNGWRLVHWTHYQLALLPLVWAVRRSPWRGGRRVERRPPGLVGRLLGAVNEIEVRSLGRFRLPWGSSLVALARKEAG